MTKLTLEEIKKEILNIQKQWCVEDLATNSSPTESKKTMRDLYLRDKLIELLQDNWPEETSDKHTFILQDDIFLFDGAIFRLNKKCTVDISEGFLKFRSKDRAMDISINTSQLYYSRQYVSRFATIIFELPKLTPEEKSKCDELKGKDIFIDGFKVGESVLVRDIPEYAYGIYTLGGIKKKKKNPWIKWKGGEYPFENDLDGNRVIKIRFRSGDMSMNVAGEYEYFFSRGVKRDDTDIIAYKDMSHKYRWDEEKQKIVKVKKEK